MKIFYRGEVIAEIMTNRSLTLEECLWTMGYDVSDQEDLERAYKKGEPWVYYSDEGIYEVDWENLE